MGKKTTGKKGKVMEKYENDANDGVNALSMDGKHDMELHKENEDGKKERKKGLEICDDDAGLGSRENDVVMEDDVGEDKKKKKKKNKKGYEIGGDDVELCGGQIENIIEINVKDKRKNENEEMQESGDSDAEFGGNQSEGVIDTDVNMDKKKKKKKKKKKSKKKHEVCGNDFEVGSSQTEAVIEGDTDRNCNENEKDEKKRKNRKIDEVVKGQTNPEEQDFAQMMKGEESDRKKKKKRHKSDKEGADVTLTNDVTDGKDRKAREQLDGKMMEDIENSGKEKNRKKKIHYDAGVRDGEANGVVEEDGSKDKKKKKAKSVKNPSEGAQRKVSFSDQVEFFPSSDGSTEAKNTQGDGLVRGKRFSKEEDEKIKKAVISYIESRRLGEEGLNMVLYCRSHPEVKNCWKEIGAALPNRPCESVYYRAHILFERDENRKWTPEELELVRKFHEKHGSDWKTLAETLGKHRFHVKDAWRRIRLPNMKKGQWSQEEYKKLFDLVNMDLRMKASEERKSKHGMLRDNISWEAISEKLETRSNAICCMKWYDQLTSPMVAEGKWSDTDDYHLVIALSSLDACCMDDVDWDNLLEHRSGFICRKRWNQMVKHLGADANKSFAEQVEILSTRYSPDVLEAREAYNSQSAVK